VKTFRSFVLVLSGALFAGAGLAQDPPTQEPPATEETPPTPEELEQRVKILERKLELAEEQKAEEKKSASAAIAGRDGFVIKSANGDFQLKLRGYVQLDGRFFLDDEERPGTDTFVVRRARPVIEGTIYKIFDFKIMPDFGNGQSLLYDGYVEGRFHPAAKVRAGKFKPPLGLERLQSATDLLFVERAAPTLLVPNRDVGVQLGGDLAAGTLEYAVGIFNGAVDGALIDSATSDGKEIDARLSWKPFQPADKSEPKLDLGLGLGVSRGDQEGSVATPLLPSFRTTGQQTFFTYRTDGTAAGTAFADGERTRIVPQGWLYSGPFGALAEYTRSEQRVRRGVASADLANEAWQLQLSWVLTGERNSFRGVTPRKPVQWGTGGRGAWIVAARISEIDVDDAAFPIYSDPTRSASKATLYSGAVSWNLARGVRFLLNYDHGKFDGGAANGADRPDEKLVLTRFQVSF
jgi:phosphate-selective porin OprO/OprP